MVLSLQYVDQAFEPTGPLAQTAQTCWMNILLLFERTVPPPFTRLPTSQESGKDFSCRFGGIGKWEVGGGG